MAKKTPKHAAPASTPSKASQRELGTAAVVVVAGALLIAYSVIFLGLFPSAHGGLGHDYLYFVPQLLAGAFWSEGNGYFSVPWFTPAFCAGVPLFPNPQSIYFSLAQLLTQLTDPLTSIKITVVAFAALAFTGFYLLLAGPFRTSRATAVLGATLFMWNGFYAYRLAIGHFTFHAFALVPLIAFLTLRPAPEGDRREILWRTTFDLALGGVMFGYMVLSGMINGLVPAVLSILVLGLAHHALHGGFFRFGLRLAAAGSVGIALCIAKLTASSAFLSHFSREAYRLPGASSITGGLAVMLESLFIRPADERVKSVFTNTEWALDRHEFEFGVTVIPLLLIVAGIVLAIRRRAELRSPSRSQWAALAVLALVLLLPVLLNYYDPALNAVLKQISLFKSSSTLVRWYSIEIPAVVLACALALEFAAPSPRLRNALAAAGVVACVLINAATDRGYYEKQPFKPGRLLTAYAALKRGVPPIKRVEQAPNDALATGVSPFPCYEPVFGYRLESLPIKTLHPGAVLDTAGGVLNLKNPACYVFGEANGCAPGDHFTAANAASGEAFAAYRPFDFKFSTGQTAANAINLIAAVAVALFLLAFGVRRALAAMPRKPTVR